MDILGNQTSFLHDYKRIVKRTPDSDEVFVTQVAKDLHTLPNFQYIVESNLTKHNERLCFPFKQEVCSTDLDGTITTRFVYIGSYFKLEQLLMNNYKLK